MRNKYPPPFSPPPFPFPLLLLLASQDPSAKLCLLHCQPFFLIFFLYCRCKSTLFGGFYFFLVLLVHVYVCVFGVCLVYFSPTFSLLVALSLSLF